MTNSVSLESLPLLNNRLILGTQSSINISTEKFLKLLKI